MVLPRPEPGLVISYVYLWRGQRRSGAREGRKARPCAIVAAAADEDGDVRVYVAPVTHAKPDDPHAVKLPPAAKRRLGLDAAPSWIVTGELNRFVWPGYDLRPISRDRPDTFAWGFLPVEIFAAVKRGIAAHRRERRLGLTARDQ
jgi:hypothetical protein